MDNARPHNLRSLQKDIQASKAEGLPHPAYSFEIVPNNFLSVGGRSMKKRLT
jgi:hypothetical protein